MTRPPVWSKIIIKRLLAIIKGENALYAEFEVVMMDTEIPKN